jgi:uncharacterized protein YndB with AHSA1/START domain
VAPLVVSTVIAAPPEAVWAAVEDVGSHVEWMADAEAIRFVGDQRQGVGTRFVCDTKVGPLRLADRMEITEWEPPTAMGVRHSGLVTGTGRFTLRPEGEGTRFTWAEELTFPWWLGGPLGELVGGRLVLAAVWRRNLAALAALVEGRPRAPGPVARLVRAARTAPARALSARRPARRPRAGGG